jgi:hypothetical protein
VNLFGFEIRRVTDEQEQKVESFAPPQKDDGASIVTTSGFGGSYSTYLDVEGTIKGEAELITRYRQMVGHSEVRAAVDKVVNEAIVHEEESEVVEIDLDEIEGLPDPVKDAIVAEFKEVLRLLEFNTSAYEIFKRWYTDGRLYYHIIIDKKRIKDGIIELRYIDPRKIKKVREVTKKRANDKFPVTVMKTKAEYYIYNEAGFDTKNNPSSAPQTTDVGLKIAKDAIVYTTSGLLNDAGNMVLSHLHEAIRPLNMLRTMEDSAVIFRLVRAPSRRVWYIDVGNLPKQKAEQVMYDMMTRHKNQLVYDPASGTIRDQRKHVTMLEDIWLSRREGSLGTKVEELPPGANLGQMEEVDYFLKKLYKALCVPLSRLDPQYAMNIGESTEITREEVEFGQFIDRLRMRFSELFLDILEKQLVLKGVLAPEDWDQLRPLVRFNYARNNYFSEIKEQTIHLQRMNVAQMCLPFVGQFVSNKWVRENVFMQTEEDMERIDEEILEEMQNPIYMVQTGIDGMPATEVPPGKNLPPIMPPQPDPKKGAKKS